MAETPKCIYSMRQQLHARLHGAPKMLGWGSRPGAIRSRMPASATETGGERVERGGAWGWHLQDEAAIGDCRRCPLRAREGQAGQFVTAGYKCQHGENQRWVKANMKYMKYMNAYPLFLFSMTTKIWK